MAKLTPPEEKLLSIWKELLDSIIRKWTVDADQEDKIDQITQVRLKNRTMVDEAVGQTLVELLNRQDTILTDVEDVMPVWREVYLYAVDAYFRLYLEYSPKRGRPRLPLKMLRELRDATLDGKSVGEIMIARGMDPNDRKAHERQRGQIRAAKALFGNGNNSGE